MEKNEQKVLALYKFLLPALPSREPLEQLKADLLQLFSEHEVKGTILLAPEGINGTICMPKQHSNAIGEYFRNHELWRGCRMRWSDFVGKEPVFHRSFVKIKKEIVSMGVDIDGISSTSASHSDCSTSGHPLAGSYIKAQEWDIFLRDNPDVDLIDCRNTYEVKMGTFERAIDPNTVKFTDFPDWLQEFGEQEKQEENATAQKPRKIAMFCTGGIRCEKSTALAKTMHNRKTGKPLFEEVYHLDGGILSYLDVVGTEDSSSSSSSNDAMLSTGSAEEDNDERKGKIPLASSTFKGECFVFDQRVSVREGLQRGTYKMCHGCRAPISKDNVHHPTFIRGIQCSSCCAEKNIDFEKHLERQMGRQRQIELAKAKGKTWIDACQESREMHGGNK